MDLIDRLSSEDAAKLERVLARAATDADFRRRLLDDPEQALIADFGYAFPGGRTVAFVERPSGADAVIVLPDPVDAAGELSEDELEAVAGGAEEDLCWSTCEVTDCGVTESGPGDGFPPINPNAV